MSKHLCKYPHLSQLLRNAMRHQGLKGKDLVALINIDKSTLSHILNGHWLPSAVTLARIYEQLDTLSAVEMMRTILLDDPPHAPVQPATEEELAARGLTALK